LGAVAACSVAKNSFTVLRKEHHPTRDGDDIAVASSIASKFGVAGGMFGHRVWVSCTATREGSGPPP